jgi:hypothetical protein
VLPLWNALAYFIPEIDGAVGQLKANIEYYELRGDELVEIAERRLMEETGEC